MAKKSKVPKAWQGLHAHRYASDPMEEVFARAWAKFNGGSPVNPALPTALDTLLSTDNRGHPPASDRDRLVACTIIQWLGSPVGQSWLDEILRSVDGVKMVADNKRFANSIAADKHTHKKEKCRRG